MRMAMKPGVRKFALTAHVTTSVGWVGAVAAFLALAIAGLTGRDAETVRGAYLALEPITRFVVLPLCLASLLTGIVSSLGTDWGLIRYHWIAIKLTITAVSTLVLLEHLPPIGELAQMAATTTVFEPDLYGLRRLMVVASAAALAALLVATALSVYKPKGMTAYGWRKQRQHRPVTLLEP